MYIYIYIYIIYFHLVLEGHRHVLVLLEELGEARPAVEEVLRETAETQQLVDETATAEVQQLADETATVRRGLCVVASDRRVRRS